MSETTKACYMLCLENDDVQLKCPTTSRSTLLSVAFHSLSHVEPKTPLPWRLSIAQAELTDTEFTALRNGFNAALEPFLHGDLPVSDHDDDLDAQLKKMLDSLNGPAGE